MPPAARNVVWLVALVGDYAGPAARYWIPGRVQQVTTGDWTVDTAHFSERFQLFIIIALGESIVVTGATASDLGLDLARGAAVAVAFVGSAALWWLYFDRVAGFAGRRLASAADAGRLARDGYTYLHLPIVAGIIVTAVGDEIVIQHPGDVLHGPDLVALVAGPILYLAGHVLFRLRMTGTMSHTRPAAMLAILACAPLGLVAPALVTAAAIAAVLALLVAWETLRGARREYAAAADAAHGALD